MSALHAGTEEAQSTDVPVVDWDIAKLTRHGNTLGALPQHLHRPKQTRAICGQSVAAASKMENHYHRSHADFMQIHAKQIGDLVERKATACSTCQFCGGRYKAWR